MSKRDGKTNLMAYNPMTSRGQFLLGMAMARKLVEVIPIPHSMRGSRNVIAMAIGIWLSSSFNSLYSAFRMPVSILEPEVFATQVSTSVSTILTYTLMFFNRQRGGDDDSSETLMNGASTFFESVLPFLPGIFRESVQIMDDPVPFIDERNFPEEKLINIMTRITEVINIESNRILRYSPPLVLDRYPAFIVDTSDKFIEGLRSLNNGDTIITEGDIEGLEIKLSSIAQDVHNKIRDQYCSLNRKRVKIARKLCPPTMSTLCIDPPHMLSTWTPISGTEHFSYNMNYDIPDCKDQELLVGLFSPGSITIVMFLLLILGKAARSCSRRRCSRRERIDDFVSEIASEVVPGRKSILYSEDNSDDFTDEIASEIPGHKSILYSDNDSDDFTDEIASEIVPGHKSILYSDNDSDDSDEPPVFDNLSSITERSRPRPSIFNSEDALSTAR